MQAVKRLFAKENEFGNDPHLAMLCMITNPVDHGMPSTGELLNGRKYKLPTVSTRPNGEVIISLQKRQDGLKMYHDRTARDLPTLSLQETVRVFNPHRKRGIWPIWLLSVRHISPAWNTIEMERARIMQ